MGSSLHTVAGHEGLVLGFGWVELTVGAAAMLGLVLLATGLATGAHYRRTRTTTAVEDEG